MKFTKEQLQKLYLKEHLENRLSYKEIREKYNIPRGTWDYYIRKKLGYSSDERIYRANDTFFDVINSEIKAYLLGFLYADGYLASDGRMGIRLKIDDIEIIKLIKQYICPENPIEYSNNQNFKRRPQCSIRWKSKNMYNRLLNLGFCVDKTHTNSDIFKHIPINMKSHFIRGFTDGDGHISNYNLETSHRKISISWSNGTASIFNDIIDYYKEYKFKLYNKNTYYVCSIDCVKDACMFTKLLYENSNYFLTRKKKIAETLFNIF